MALKFCLQLDSFSGIIFKDFHQIILLSSLCRHIQCKLGPRASSCSDHVAKRFSSEEEKGRQTEVDIALDILIWRIWIHLCCSDAAGQCCRLPLAAHRSCRRPTIARTCNPRSQCLGFFLWQTKLIEMTNESSFKFFGNKNTTCHIHSDHVNGQRLLPDWLAEHVVEFDGHRTAR